MSLTTLPQTLDAAHALIGQQQARLEQLQWRVEQLEKQLYGPTSDRALATEHLSKEQILLSLFPPPAEPPATSEVAVPPATGQTEVEKTPRRRQMRTPAARQLETVTQRLEPAEKVCPHCGKDKCEIGCEKSERFEYCVFR